MVSNDERMTEAHLGEDIVYVVVTLLHVLDAACTEACRVPPVVDDDKTKVKPVAHLIQVVRLLARPVVIMQVLLVLYVRVDRDVHRLVTGQHSKNLVSSLFFW